MNNLHYSRCRTRKRAGESRISEGHAEAARDLGFYRILSMFRKRKEPPKEPVRRQTVEEFLAAGGTITRVKPGVAGEISFPRAKRGGRL